MLIISKFHDYYDALMRQGVDKTLVYKRATVESEFVEFPRGTMSTYENHSPACHPAIKLTADRIIIVFCGQVRHYWRGEVRFTKGNGEQVVDTFYRSKKREVFDAMRAAYKLPVPKSKLYSYRYKPNGKSVTLKEAVQNFDWQAVHNRLKCPVLMLRGTSHADYVDNNVRVPDYASGNQVLRIVENPVLKDVGFERHVDPYTAWQELSMFIGGVLGQPDKPMVQLTDVDLRNKHGMDKWSFKTMPAA